jgi:hypothetical protein
MPFSLRRPASRLRTLAFCLCLAGCSHYQTGTQGQLAFDTLYVAPVMNKTMIPQAQSIISSGLRDALAKDGRVTLVNSPQAADATLSVVLIDYHRDVAAVREQDTGLASKFTLTLGATCTLRDNRKGRAYFENRPISVERDVFTDNGMPSSPLTGDQLQAEYNTVPFLAESLGDKVAHTVLDVW